jgi:hypothetical protein
MDTVEPTPDDFQAAIERTEANEALRERTEYERRIEERSTPTTRTDVGVAGAEPYVTRETTRVVEGDAPRPFSIAAGFLGWAVATFFTIVLTGILLAFLGNAAYNAGVVTGNTFTISQNTLNNLTLTGLVGGLVAIFIAYFVGGYNAGRVDRSHGVAQGVAVVAWTVVFAAIGALFANYAATFFDLGAYLAPYNVDYGALTTQTLVALVIALLVMLGGAALGGLAGERWPRYGMAVEERRTYGRAWTGGRRV